MCGGVDLIWKGIYWRIGDGATTHPFTDPWIPRPYSFRPITNLLNVSSTWRVTDFIIDGQWNIPFLNQAFLPLDVDIIKYLPISQSYHRDQVCWYYDPSWKYMVKSGYKLACVGSSESGQSGLGANYGWWRSLWKAKIVTKVKICLWRAFHDAFPCQSNLIKRHVPYIDCCPWCKMNGETLLHSLWSCPFANQVWTLCSLWPKISCFFGFAFGGLCLFVISRLDKNEFEIFHYIFWYIWNARNRLVFTNTACSSLKIVEDE